MMETALLLPPRFQALLQRIDAMTTCRTKLRDIQSGGGHVFLADRPYFTKLVSLSLELFCLDVRFLCNDGGMFSLLTLPS